MRNKILKIILGSVLIALYLYLFYNSALDRRNQHIDKYNYAVQLYNQENYAEAAQIFLSMRNWSRKDIVDILPSEYYEMSIAHIPEDSICPYCGSILDLED